MVVPKIIDEGIKVGICKCTIIVNSRLFPWSALAVLRNKLNQKQRRLTFNYHYIHEEKPASQLELIARAQDMVSHLSIQTYFLFDVKHDYWSLKVYLNNKYYLPCYCPRKGQL